MVVRKVEVNEQFLDQVAASCKEAENSSGKEAAAPRMILRAVSAEERARAKLAIEAYFSPGSDDE